LFLLQIGRWFR